MLFEKHIHCFKEYLQLRNYSELTINQYNSSIKRFVEFLEEYYKRVDSLEKITKDILLDYHKYIMNLKMKNGLHYSNSTQGTKLKALRTFFKYLMKMDFILRDPSTIISMPKEEQRLTRNILTQDEMVKLLKSIKLNTPVNIRNRAIIEVLYSCGMRTFELCDLKLQDIDLKNFTVTIVKGKGNKSRILPLGQYAAHYIEVYLERARKYMLKFNRKDPGYLFLSIKGNKFSSTSINKTVIPSVLRKTSIKKHISFYSFRHAVATHLLENKVDIAYIAQLLGHSSLRTTQRYLQIEISELKKLHSQYHPREKE